MQKKNRNSGSSLTFGFPLEQRALIFLTLAHALSLSFSLTHTCFTPLAADLRTRDRRTQAAAAHTQRTKAAAAHRAGVLPQAARRSWLAAPQALPHPPPPTPPAHHPRRRPAGRSPLRGRVRILLRLGSQCAAMARASLLQACWRTLPAICAFVILYP